MILFQFLERVRDTETAQSVKYNNNSMKNIINNKNNNDVKSH